MSRDIPSSDWYVLKLAKTLEPKNSPLVTFPFTLKLSTEKFVSISEILYPLILIMVSRPDPCIMKELELLIYLPSTGPLYMKFMSSKKPLSINESILFFVEAR